jgi:SAM-dependent methyltransferase
LSAAGFQKLSNKLFQKPSGSTPEEYGQNYIDRWGETDWLANAKLAAQQMLEHIPPHLDKKSMKVIDVGCLNGYIMESLRQGGVKEIFGTDISYFLAVEKNLNPEFLTGITVGDFSQNNYPSAAFDVVVCMEVLEHIPPEVTQKFVAELARITKPDGILLISTSEDWQADDTHINCRNRAEWYYEFGRVGLVPHGSQVIFPGFNSFVVRPAKNFVEDLSNRGRTMINLWRAGRLPRPEDR